ncbi:MAG: WD40 repeat protein [Bacteroidia bacterium]
MPMLIATLLFTSSLQLSSIEAASPPVQAARAVAEFGSNDLRHLARLEDLEYSPDGATVAAVSVDGHLNLWSSESGALLGNFRQPSGSPLFQVTFLDPQTLLYGAGTNRLGALGIQSDGVLEEAPLERFGLGDLQDSGGGVSVAPGGEYLCQWILAKGEGVQLASINDDGSKGKRMIVGADGFRISHVAWSPRGDLLAVLTLNPLKSLGRGGSEDQDMSHVMVIDPATGEELVRLKSKDTPLTAVDFALVAYGGKGTAAKGLIVTGGHSGLGAWDLASGRLLSTFGADLGRVTSLDARDCGDGSSDVVVSSDAGITQSWRVFSEEAPAKISDLPEFGSLGRISIHPRVDQLRFAGVESRTISQWVQNSGDIAWNEDPYIPRHEGVVSALAAAPGSIASAGYDGYVHLWDYELGADGSVVVESRARLLANPNPQSLVTDVDLSSDGKSMASCGRDGVLRQWDLNDGEDGFGSQVANWTPDNMASFTTTRISPDGSLITAVSADQILWVRDAKSGELLRRFEGLSGLQFASSFSADGRLFAVGSTGARIYNTQTWELVRSIEDLGAPIMKLDLSPNGKLIAIATAANSLVVRDVQTGGLLTAWTNFQGRPNAACWVNNAVIVASGPNEGGFRILSVSGAEGTVGQPGRKATSPHGGDVQALSVLPSGHVVSAAADGFLHIWDLGL